MSTLFGWVLLVIFVLVLLASESSKGTGVNALWSSHGALVVIGGSLVATVLAHPTNILGRIPALVWETARPIKLEMPSIVATLVRISDKLRSGGVQAINSEIKGLNDDFLKRGLQYISEGFDAKEIQDLMEADLVAIRQRHRFNVGIFESLGGYSPTMGILGTVLSMVAVLGNLERPEQLGPQIADAMLATLYGVGAANLIFLPVANKLKKLSEEELRIRWVMIEVVIALQGRASPRMIRERLKVSLPPTTRKMIQDVKSKKRRAQTAPMEEMVVPQAEEYET